MREVLPTLNSCVSSLIEGLGWCYTLGGCGWARSESAEDPLVTELIQLAGRWPLSAVGITGAAEGDVKAIVTDACLLRMYVDRIIARHDFPRLANERVREATLQAIGAFPELMPEVAAMWGVSELE